MAFTKCNDLLDDELKILAEGLGNLSKGLVCLSHATLSLPTDRAVGGESQAAANFRKQRDKIFKDSVMYQECILPEVTTFVNNVSDYFESYQEDDEDEWKESLRDTRKQTSKYKKEAKILLEMHECILVSLKEREQKINEIALQFEGLQEEYDRQKKHLHRNAIWKSISGSALLGLSKTNLVSPPLSALFTLGGSLVKVAAENDMESAVAKEKKSRIQGRVAFTIKESLIPALHDLINGLQAAAGFFSIMENELETFGKKADQAVEKKLKAHYQKMRRKAGEIVRLCMAFQATLPAIRSNFKAIPTV